ncbi:MAG TPA: HAD family phosphatase, partial [Xanthomonadales bacterium]|nr:HAD family phosphatase [Xanthomonadales bacterium]
MNKIKAVIFDMDGLIVDTEPLESQSLIKVLSEYGKTPQLYDTGLVHIVGNAASTYTDLMEEHGINEDLDTFRNKKREIFAKLLENKLTLFDGFFKLIDILTKRKIKIALASNRF